MLITDALIEQYIHPVNELEWRICTDPDFRKGLEWGEPRFGHPEGKIIYHIEEVLANVNLLTHLSTKDYHRLRIITLVHDTFKNIENRGMEQFHGLLARNFVAQFTNDPAILNITEFHDEAYFYWKIATQQGQQGRAIDLLFDLADRVENYLQLYYLFFKCDTRTGDKVQLPIKWFEGILHKKIKVFHFL
jgi:hypothetical protein